MFLRTRRPNTSASLLYHNFDVSIASHFEPIVLVQGLFYLVVREYTPDVQPQLVHLYG